MIDDRSRKSVTALTEEDLKVPVWTFCSDEEDIDGQDETTVRPIHDVESADLSPGTSIIAADVLFADGRTAVGYLYSGPLSNIGNIQPTVLIDGHQVNFWLGVTSFIPDVNQLINSKLSLLKASRNAVFPVSFRPRIALDGTQQNVTLSGFMALDETRKVVTI